MKRKAFKVFATGVLTALTISTLVSCGSETTARNTVTPYSSFADKLSDKVAEANNGEYSMTFEQYYAKLKYNSYDLLTTKIQNVIYEKEFNALTGVYKNATLEAFKNDSKYGDASLEYLKFTDSEDEDEADKLLYEITDEKYNEIRNKLLLKINSNLSSVIFSSSSAKAILKYTEAEAAQKEAKMVDNMAQIAIDINPKTDIKFVSYGMSGYLFDEDDDVLQFDQITLDKFETKVNETILTEAKNLSARKALYKIADQEYIYNEDTETYVKNNNYLFKDSSLKQTYEQNFKKYGKYHAVIIQFNSRKDAEDAMAFLGEEIESYDKDTKDVDKAFNQYKKLYEYYYNYRQDDTTDKDSDAFTFVVNEKKNDLSKISTSMQTLIQDTLEDGQWLTEPRNINNKYVLAMRISTEYYNPFAKDYSYTEEKEYKDFNDDELYKINKLVKEKIINDNNSYINTNEENLYEDAKIEIYDPFLENRFYQSYSDSYTLLDHSVNKNDQNILKINDTYYSVEDFYKDASKKYAQTIIPQFFELQFAYTYYDYFVKSDYNLYLIDDEEHDNNVSALDDSINAFNNGENSVYDKALGLETFLLGTYGYTNKDDVIKYYYDATSALSTYKKLLVFDSWRKDDGDDSYSLADNVKDGYLSYLLETGNKNYDKLLELNADHVLINIDDDGDGSPDDPNEFTSKMNDTELTQFNKAVVAIAQAIYQEATYLNTSNAYAPTTYYEALTFVKKMYNKGDEFKSGTFKDADNNTFTSWDELKEQYNYNFLLTVENLQDITQSSVTNYVLPFQTYIKGIYKTMADSISAQKGNGNFKVEENDNYKEEFNSGNGYFYFFNTDNETAKFGLLPSQVEDISMDTLCETQFGYHMIIVNNYDTPDYLTFTSDDDSTGYQDAIELILRKYTDNNDEEKTVKLTISSYNDTDDAKAANFNQFFIYYIETINGQSSSLDSDIKSLLDDLFSSVISTYKGDSFQEYLILNSLNITIKDSNIKSNVIDNKLNSLRHSITEYKEKKIYEEYTASYIDNDLSIYESWFDSNKDWAKPNIKK